MNIGQLPPILIWPYTLTLLLMGKSIWFMLNVLSEEQRKLIDFFMNLKAKMEKTTLNSLDILENYLVGGYGRNLFYLPVNALKLYFGGIFLLVFKVYLLWRHLNYIIFAIIYYWATFLGFNHV